jgi:uncharacterized protein
MQTTKTGASCKRRFIVKGFLLLGGTVSLVLGVIGIVLPILPTTPFLLLSAACYFKSSDRMYNWLIGHKWFGKYIKNYRDGKGIPLKTKIFAIAALWAAVLYSTFLVVSHILIAQIAMIIVAIGVSIHLVRLPTCK